MSRLGLIALFTAMACSSTPQPAAETAESASTEREPQPEPEPEVEPQPEPEPQPELEISRAPCESPEERALDIESLLRIAIGHIQTETNDWDGTCVDPAPVCALPADGTRCTYRLSLYPEVVRVAVWPAAANGVPVQTETVVYRDGRGPATLEENVEEMRWAVGGAVRCRGEMSQRSYGGGASTGPVTTGRVEVTCFNGDDVAHAVRAVAVSRRGPRGGNARVRDTEPHELAAGAETRLTISFDPISLLLRTSNPFDVTLDVDGRRLSPVAVVMTPERLPRQ